MTASSASSCLWMAHPELDKRQRRERRASWAHSLVACTYVRAPGEKTEQEFEERYALIARPWLTPVNWQELRNEFLALRCTTEEVAHQQKHLNVLTERQQWGYSTFHRFSHCCPNSSSPPTAEMKDIQQQCGLRLINMKLTRCRGKTSCHSNFWLLKEVAGKNIYAVVIRQQSKIH